MFDQVRIDRIKYMEMLYDQIQEAIGEYDKKLSQCAASADAAEYLSAVQEQLEELRTYYTSPVWMSDFDADRRGEIPRDLKRGILTEDAIYDLLIDWEERNSDD